ncbi:MAG: Flp pilus assembly protein CpaB [Bdellovibrionales bacterium]|nr:Flp pilus assembly protein CpaB [Bdellovibrionales bacterium]
MNIRTSSRGRPRRLGRRLLPTPLTLGGLVGAVGICFGVAMGPAEESTAVASPGEGALQTVQIPVPVRAVARGERLGQVEFTTVEWPKRSLTESYIQEVQSMREAVALSQLPPYLPIPSVAVAAEGTEANAVVNGIPLGMRAITVRVDAEAAVEGWARSGNNVDVILLRQGSDTTTGIDATVIAENVRILSAGRSTEPLAGQTSAPQAPATVTLLVTQEDALKVKTAQTVGKLTFSLRASGDEDPTLAVSVNQRDLLGAPRNALPRREVYRGRAVGPDGKTYLLGDDARWVRTLGEQASGGPVPQGESDADER